MMHVINPPMAKGEGGWLPPQQVFFTVFLGNGKDFISNKIFAVVSSSIKHFLDLTNHLGSKIRQRKGAGGGNHPMDFFSYFSDHEDDI